MSRIESERLRKWIETACVQEATAPKAGNVHPQASFADLTYQDFLDSAQLTAEILCQVPQTGVSECILQAMQAVKRVVGRNTNLGIVLLLTPLAAVPEGKSLAEGIAEVLDRLQVQDTARIYEAIRVTQPGGMQEVAEQDLSQAPTLSVREVMQLAADHDMIARQYAQDFRDVLEFGLPRLQFWWQRCSETPLQAIVGLHLDWMQEFPDTLIARKGGPALAEESARRAGQVLSKGWPERAESQVEFQKFDQWLRAEGNRRNPGTSADLVAACLFAAQREGLISWDDQTN